MLQSMEICDRDIRIRPSSYTKIVNVENTTHYTNNGTGTTVVSYVYFCCQNQMLIDHHHKFAHVFQFYIFGPH